MIDIIPDYSPNFGTHGETSVPFYVYILIALLVLVLIGIIIIIFITLRHKKVDDTIGTSDRNNIRHITETASIINKVDGIPGTANQFDAITFQFENGDRKQFFVADKDFYNQVIVGDKGALTYAGKALIKFKRSQD